MLCGKLPFDDDYIPNLFKKINGIFSPLFSSVALYLTSLTLHPLSISWAQGGIFTIPSFLNVAERDLLTSMLAVDPLKRITMQEIRYGAFFLD
jgi:serine/threonine protein kinase